MARDHNQVGTQPSSPLENLDCLISCCCKQLVNEFRLSVSDGRSAQALFVRAALLNVFEGRRLFRCWIKDVKQIQNRPVSPQSLVEVNRTENVAKSE